MKKKWWVVIAVIFLIFAGVYLYSKINWVMNEERIPDYYNNLRIQFCEDLSDNSLVSPSEKKCCLNSVDEMEKYGYLMSDGDCLSGFSGPIVMRCINGGGIPFCVPDKEPIESIDDCFKLGNDGDFFNPVSFSNEERVEAEGVDEETRVVDSCIFYFVDEHDEIVDEGVCDKIGSPYYFYLCHQRIAFHTNDSGLCNLEYLGVQSNVDGCDLHFYEGVNPITVRCADIEVCDDYLVESYDPELSKKLDPCGVC